MPIKWSRDQHLCLHLNRRHAVQPQSIHFLKYFFHFNKSDLILSWPFHWLSNELPLRDLWRTFKVTLNIYKELFVTVQMCQLVLISNFNVLTWWIMQQWFLSVCTLRSMYTYFPVIIFTKKNHRSNTIGLIQHCVSSRLFQFIVRFCPMYQYVLTCNSNCVEDKLCAQFFNLFNSFLTFVVWQKIFFFMAIFETIPPWKVSKAWRRGLALL